MMPTGESHRRFGLGFYLPVGFVLLVTCLVMTDVVTLDDARYLFWGGCVLVGGAFLVQYSVWSKWWRRGEGSEYKREIVIWTTLVFGAALIAMIAYFVGPDAVPRLMIGYIVAAAAFLALCRRYALYLRTRRRTRAREAEIKAQIAVEEAG